MNAYLKARFSETSSHLAIAGWIMLPLLMWDGLLPLFYWPFGACLVLFLFPESIKESLELADMAGLPVPPKVQEVLELAVGDQAPVLAPVVEAAAPPPNPTPTVAAIAAMMILAVGLGACAGQEVPWTPQQTAYIELTIAMAVEQVSANEIAASGLSDADIADIKVGAESFESGVRSAVATISAGGDVSQQAVSAVVSAVTSAASHMGNLITAKRGANIKPETALIMAGESALQDLPEVVSAIILVDHGFQPTQTDLDAATMRLDAATKAVTGP